MAREIENPTELIDRMFSEYQLDEYFPAWEAMKAEYERVSAELFKNKLEAIGHGKDAA